MDTLIIFLVISLLSFFGLLFFIYQHFRQEWVIKHFLKDFKRKMWMTLSLGLIFLTIYLFIVVLSSYAAEKWGTKLLFLIYQDPIPYVYGGLWLFACFSLGIYLSRMVIKYLFLTRGKDN